ncbi:hypothetical protein C7974DRAFT_203234 [Boeremia exigua]|uniref:uncharacterized protein n=1 Tax=Boeremia exigua TaxID=749465 RepID=UPI001E8DDC88|nr:uncharacterized protein C7974DRAFT_203234 [Boeremia exigua]KAH6625582.1 hypothetical protein C7974DRAFT_203234 [Boeremia exigua]
MNDHVRQVQPRPQPDPKQKPTVRTHKRAFLLLAFYIPLVVIPWVVTLVLVYRPMTKSSWTYGPGFSYKDYKVMQGWAKAIPIMNVFAAIFAISVTSSVIAQVAVLFAQRRHAGQQMSVRRLFALADRVWCDWAALPRTLMDGEKSANWIFLLGAVTVFLGAIQHPLVQILVPWEDVRIPNCASTRFITERDYGMLRCDALSREPALAFQSIGIDLEPAQMAIISASSIIPRISSDLSSYTRGSDISYMWQAEDKYGASIPTNLDNADQQVWIAALPADTTTGVLREHIMRLNSSVSCTNLTASAFPSTCTGTNPFRASFNYESWETRWNGTLEVCAPGDQGTYPWTLSRNRQEITEELFIRYAETYVSESFGDDSRDGVIHCTAQTSRGYFELGNFYNGGQAGPLLDKWPSREVPYQYHDYFEQELTATSDRRPPYIPSEV